MLTIGFPLSKYPVILMLLILFFVASLYSSSAYCLISFTQGNMSDIGTFLMAVNKHNQSEVEALVKTNTLLSFYFVFKFLINYYT